MCADDFPFSVKVFEGFMKVRWFNLNLIEKLSRPFVSFALMLASYSPSELHDTMVNVP